MTTSLLVTGLSLSGTGTASAATDPGIGATINATSDPALAPLKTTSAPLAAETAVHPLSCDGDLCTSTTLRPELTASSNESLRFAIFDVVGQGGTTSPVAESPPTNSGSYAPPAGLLLQAHTYYWAALDSQGNAVDSGTFAVDLQRDGVQPQDSFGPLQVDLASGDVSLSLSGNSIQTIDDSYSLNLTYDGTLVDDGQDGATPLRDLSPGWQISGDILGDANYYALQSFQSGDVLVQAADGSDIFYTRAENGSYTPPQISGSAGASTVFPTLTKADDGSYDLIDSSGGFYHFSSLGKLETYSKPSPSGAASVELGVTWTSNHLSKVTDEITGRSATFIYGGDRNCPTVSVSGFTASAPVGHLCQMTNFDGSVMQFWYVGQNLGRVVFPGGECTDFAYDASGHLVQVRPPLADDALVQGVRTQLSGLTWNISYDGQGRVASITSPRPTAGAAPVVHNYNYGNGTTSVTDGDGTTLSSYTFDPIGYRTFSSDVAGSAPVTYAYASDGELLSTTTASGLESSTIENPRGQVTDEYGPAPSSWFTSSGTPTPQEASAVGHSTRQYDQTADLHGFAGGFFDGLTSGHYRAIEMVNHEELTQLPASVSGTSWRAVLWTTIVRPASPVEYRVVFDDQADAAASSLVVANQVCPDGQPCELPAAPEAIGTTVQITYARSGPPTTADPATFTLQESTDQGASWSDIPLSQLQPMGLQSSSSLTDTYASGAPPATTTSTTSYSNPIIGSVSETAISGTDIATTMTQQALDPSQGELANVAQTTSPSGSTTSNSYYTGTQTATNPLTGTAAVQAGLTQSITQPNPATGSPSGQQTSYVYDSDGREVAMSINGSLRQEEAYDARGRLYEVVDPAQGPNAQRQATIDYAANGNPFVIQVQQTNGTTTQTSSVTTDLLGRTISSTDAYGDVTTYTYDATSQVVSQVTTSPSSGNPGAPLAVTTAYTYNPNTTLASQTTSFDGQSYGATVNAYDVDLRPVQITYSNGVKLALSYNDTGAENDATYTLPDGAVYSDSTQNSTQTGRILTDTYTAPDQQAVFGYTYDPATGALTGAQLSDNGPIGNRQWSYGYAAPSASTCTPGTYSTKAYLDGARSSESETTSAGTTTWDYCDNYEDAPTKVVKVDPSGQSNTVPVSWEQGNLTSYDGTTLRYDSTDQLVSAKDASGTAITLTRDAFDQVESQTTTEGSTTTTRRFGSGGLLLDGSDQVVGLGLTLPGGTSLTVEPSGGSWSYPNLQGNAYFGTDNAGTASSDSPTLYDPDGNPLTTTRSARNPSSAFGYQMGSGATTLALDTPLVVTGERTYVPGLGIFSTIDPMPNGGRTAYSYANDDPINQNDPSGQNTWDDVYVSSEASWTAFGVGFLAAILIVFPPTFLIGLLLLTALTLYYIGGAVYYGLQGQYLTMAFFIAQAVLCILAIAQISVAFRVARAAAAEKAALQAAAAEAEVWRGASAADFAEFAAQRGAGGGLRATLKAATTTQVGGASRAAAFFSVWSPIARFAKQFPSPYPSSKPSSPEPSTQDGSNTCPGDDPTNQSNVGNLEGSNC